VTTALYPGSFDPFHLGHLGTTQQAARSFDEVVVAVLGNPQKQSGLFPVPERVDLVTASVAHLANVRCVAFDGLTIDLAKREDAAVIVRAAHKDLRAERSMANANEMLSGIRTFFTAPEMATATISSTMVRILMAQGETAAAAALVPPPVAVALRAQVLGA
jgi:pantetheine-phosphate adenylyltransferase